MDSDRPSKRRRAIPDSSSSASDPSNFSSAPAPAATLPPTTLSSRPKQSQSRSRPPSSSPTKSKPKSLHNFFQPASEGQRWSSKKFEALPTAAPGPATATATIDADDIEDDYDSYDEIFSQLDSTGKRGESQSSVQKPSRALSKRTATKATAATALRPKRQPSKRFLMPSTSTSTSISGSTNKEPRNSSTALTAPPQDTRPWAQRFAPSNLDELAVHKRKVSDVQRWLDDVFKGRRKEKLLVLRGPAGSGKTTTVSLLSQALGYDIIEWRNPPVPEITSQDYVSSSAQFEEFLGRGDHFGGLDLREPDSINADANTNDPSSSSNRRVLLIEEFPTVLNRNSSTLTAFRTSLQRYLAAATEDQSQESRWTHPPIVMIVSETLLSSASSISDNLTVHRLLGPTLYNHPGTTIIDFNSIAATFMQKALRTVLEKESQSSKRIRIPGPAALTKIAEIGDIRSAISSLEFLCLKSGTSTSSTWGGSLTKTKTKKKSSSRTGTGTDKETPLTPMEQESLELIFQRESSLGMFHAVGKIVYNKRLDQSLIMPASDSDSKDSTSTSIIPPQPPDHLSEHRRTKISQVAVDDLMDETGTDISTFISALHENYPPSCDGIDFTDSLNACIDALSDSDILAGGNRRSTSNRGARGGIGIGSANLNAGVDMLRQDEISFQVACRGLLFALPYPVKRKITPAAGSGSGHRRPGDAYKMLYPSSLRLWRTTEEVDGLVDSWLDYMLDPVSHSQRRYGNGDGDREGDVSGMSGVSAWRSRRLGYVEEGQGQGTGSGTGIVTMTMIRRHDAVLEYLPYLVQIKNNDSGIGQLRQITSIRGSRLEGEGEEEDGDGEEDLVEVPRWPYKDKLEDVGASQPFEEKLILSDDDIED